MHASRLKYYHDETLNVSSELIDHISSQGMTLETDQLKDLRLNPSNSKWEILVSWRGFDIVEDSWEPFENLWTDIPRKTLEFLTTRGIEQHSQVKQLSRKHKAKIKKTSEKMKIDVQAIF